MSTDGVAGLYTPSPAENPVARVMGQGLSGIGAAEDLARMEQARLIHGGELLSLHSWELVTAVDGPGTRLTTFLSGCPLRCLYCHNPDTMDMRRGTMVPTQDIVKRMLRYKRIFKRTDGGITISGGEPLMQPAGVARLLRAARENGIHTAIDTSGFLGSRCTDEMLDDLSLVLLDIKSGDEETYKRLTSQSLQPTLDFAKRLGEHGVPVWVRFVVVPGYTDDPENVRAVAQIAASIPTVERVEVLAFHQMGRDKWASLGLTYELEDVSPPTPEQMNQARAIFKSFGLPVF